MMELEEILQNLEDFEILAGHSLDALESHQQPGGERKLRIAKEHLADLIDRLSKHRNRIIDEGYEQ